MRVLVVEDEVSLAQAIARLLEEENFQVDMTHDGEEAFLLATTVPYEAIVLDWMLPGMSGIDIVTQVRAHSISTPILMLTAKDAVANRVEGLNAGADDYLVKPFATEELIARVHALARRPNDFMPDTTILYEDMRFDLTTRTVSYQNQQEVLSPKEASILEMLIRHSGQVLTRQQLMDTVWGYEADVLEGVLDTYVHHLRKRLAAIEGPSIQTVRGVGYLLKKAEG